MIAGIVLAAGESTRMGRPKQLIEVGGKTLLQHVVDAALASKLEPVFVVVGHRAAEVRVSLESRSVTFVENANYRQGLSTSVRSGVGMLPQGAEAAMFLLGDQPGVTIELIDRLVDRAASENIVAPSFRGRRGNPTVFGRRWFSELLQASGDSGGRHVIDEHPEALMLVEAEDVPDLDTPQDVEAYAALRSSSKRA